ncbi:hypothetical protein E4N94_11340 [Treponema denticola]|uniref:hypothetical protein n=1 Tax=Treponema denticola TaxID=158 RepID=UPI003D939306
MSNKITDIMDQAYGSMLVDIYKRVRKSSEVDSIIDSEEIWRTTKELVNNVMRVFGGEYERIPRTWIENHLNDPNYSSEKDCIVVKILNKAVKDGWKDRIPVFWIRFITFLYWVINENILNDCDFQEAKKDINIKYIKNIKIGDNEDDMFFGLIKINN